MPSDPSAARLVLVTMPDVDAGRRFAHALVSEALAACVSVVPGVTSIYLWEGRVEESSETLCVVKTTAGRVQALAEALPRLHPYDVPEFVVLAPEFVAPRYLAWLQAACGA